MARIGYLGVSDQRATKTPLKTEEFPQARPMSREVPPAPSNTRRWRECNIRWLFWEEQWTAQSAHDLRVVAASCGSSSQAGRLICA
jgi:hypothetical protein